MKINKEHKAYPALLMGGVALIVCSLLLLISEVTKEPIAQRKLEDLNKVLSQVLPQSSYDNALLETLYEAELEGKKWQFYRAQFEGLNSAIVLFNQSPGYSGDIQLLLAINADGSLSGVRVLSHTETPGLGDLIEVAKSDWIKQFSGLSLGKPPISAWKVSKDGGQFDAFTGATITPRAVIKGIVESLQLFETHRAYFLNQGNLSLSKKQQAKQPETEPTSPNKDKNQAQQEEHSETTPSITPESNDKEAE